MLNSVSITRLSLVGALVFVLAAAPALAAPEGDAPSRTMTVSGNGIATGKPDIATINLGVLSEAKTATAALAENNQKMSMLFSSLKKAGIKEDDIQTSRFDVSPRYAKNHTGSSYSERRIDGYRVSNQVHVIVRDLDRFGKILDAAVGDGANTMNRISFGFSDPEPLVDKARINAILDAKRKAALYAETAEIGLGKILTFQEQYSGSPQPKQARMMAENMSSVPIAVGESQISASVTITFELN